MAAYQRSTSRIQSRIRVSYLKGKKDISTSKQKETLLLKQLSTKIREAPTLILVGSE